MNIFQSESFLAAAEFFVITLTELLVLFVLISMFVYWLQDKFPAARIQRLLSGGSGYFAAAALGTITPFCSCSTVPMLVGMLRAKANFGPVMTFLLTSPLLNPILVAMMFTIFGASLTLIYAGAVLMLALGAGAVLAVLKFDRFVTLPPQTAACCGSEQPRRPVDRCCKPRMPQPPKPTRLEKTGKLFQRATKDVKAFLPQLIIAVIVGAWIHGFVPAEFFAQFSQVSGWYVIPLAALLGIPLYVRASSMIPLALSLVGKGMSYGSVVALTIGGAGASLPELIILKRIFQWPLLIAFIGVVFVTACATGIAIDLTM